MSLPLGPFADRLGVGERLSSAVGWSGPGVDDRGSQAMLMLAGGGESCHRYRIVQPSCSVCSATLYRTFTDSLADTLVNRQDPRRHTGGDR